jgi:hypothetical protein
MSVFTSSFSEGQHVVLRRDLDGGLWPLGYPAVKRGARGIVRSQPAGFFSDRYEIEFLHGGRVRVSGRHLRPAMYGRGEDAWRRYKANRAGVRLGMLLLALPAIIAVARYYLHGGTTAGLIAATPEAVGGTLLGASGKVIGLIGLPLFLLLVGILWLRARRRR